MKIVSAGLILMESIALMALIAGTGATFAQEGPDNPQPLSAETIPCPMTLPEGDIDGETMVCGQIEVPENWDNPGQRTLLITYAIAKAKNESPFVDPIIFFDGGPGISALGEIEWLNGNTSRLRQTRDIIFFDQRGIRFSGGLECPPEIINVVNEIELPEDVDPEETLAAINNLSLDSDVEALLEAAELLGPGDEVLNCAPYFEEQGIDLSQYGSYSSTLDAIALMAVLDYPYYNLYGISYGSEFAMEVMRFYDENDAAPLPEIRSVVIDGIIGTWVDWATNNAIWSHVVVVDAFEACEADAVCSNSYPNIRQRMIHLLDAVEATPLVIDESTTITIDDLVPVLRSNATDKDGIVYLPRLVDELERGEAELFLLLQNGTLPVVSDPDLPELSNPFDPISLEANDIATQMRTLADEVENLAAQSRRLSEAYDRGLPMPQFFADELAVSAEQLPPGAKLSVSAFLRATSISSPDRNQLLQVISVFPEAERNLLVSLVGLMDDEDVAEVYEILADPLYSERLIGKFSIISNVIHCNDRTHDLNRTFETLRAVEAPQLVMTEGILYNFGLVCAGYGLSGTPSEPITNSSEFPVLISNGALDSSTPVIWGEQVFENLENARMVTFPNSGHGATRETNCGRDITNAFFMYPEREFNDECIETLRPAFVLPDDELPE